jgi:hypothetical protein
LLIIIAPLKPLLIVHKKYLYNETKAVSRLLQRSLFQALVADTRDNNVLMIDLSPIPNFIGERDIINERPHKIHDFPAFAADSMVVQYVGRLKPGYACGRLNLVDESMTRQGGKSSVYRIERNCRKFHLQAVVQRFRCGMIGRHEQFSIDFQALSGDFESGLSACSLKGSELFL